MSTAEVITAIGGIIAGIIGYWQWHRGRKDQAKQLAAASQMEERERHWQELRDTIEEQRRTIELIRKHRNEIQARFHELEALDRLHIQWEVAAYAHLVQDDPDWPRPPMRNWEVPDE